MSLTTRLRHRVLIKHPDPAATADDTGQLIVDETGQPIGDPTVTATDDWSDATEVRALIEERKAHWPDGPGAGAELVETRVFLERGAIVRELDKLRRIDVEPAQDYQVTFVNDYRAFGHLDHVELVARRIPL